MIDRGFTEEYKQQRGYKPVTMRKMVTSEALMQRLDYASKVDRSESHITALIEDGEGQAREFLADLDGHRIDPE